MDMQSTCETYGALILLSLAFLMMIGAQGNLEALQTSLNAEQGLGMVTLPVIYFSALVGTFMLTPILVHWFSPKWTIVVGLSALAIFTLADFYQVG